MSNSKPATERSEPILLTFLKRRWRLLNVLGVLLLTYTLLGTLLAPHLINQYATEYVHNEMHRQLHLGKVQFNPFTLSLRIGQTNFSEQNGAPIVRFDHLLVNAELSSLFTGSYNFKQIQLNAPNLNVVVDTQGNLNLDFSAPNMPEPAPSDAPLPAIRIGELQLSNGLVRLEDHSRPQPFITELKPIEFMVKDFRTEPNHGNAFHFTGASKAEETFDWQGDFTVQPLGSTGKLQIAGLKASTLQSYLQESLPMRLLAGEVSIQGDYQLAVNERLELKLNLPSIDVNAVQVAPKHGDDTPWVSLSTMQLIGTQVSLQQRNVAIQKVRIDGLQLNAWLDQDYKLNLLELLGPDEPSEKPWNSAVKDIELVNARMQIEDRSIAPTAQFTLFPVLLQVQNFSSAPHTTININTKIHINERADFDAAGTIDLDTLSSQLKLRLSNFALKDVQNYVATSTDMLVSDGRLTTEGDLYYQGDAANKHPQLKFTGNVEVTDLSTQDTLENKDFIKWQSLQLKNLSYSMAPDTLTIEQMIARQPYGRVIIDSDGSTNIQHVLRIQPEPATNDKAKPTAKVRTAAPTMRTRITKVIIADGSANFTDNSVQPTFSTGMQRLNGAITGLSSANDSRAKITLDGSVDNHAPVTITGEANFLAADTYSDVAMNFRNMELTTFNPYSGKFAGYSIAKGKLSTELRYRIQDRKLDAQHHIVVDQLEFGAATDSKDAVPLPIKLAVSLLKDRNGVIDLNLPVSGSLDDPQFKVGPVVWKAFLGLLTKIATAPFSALGSLFGGGPELAYVDFVPGSTNLSAIEADKLSKLAKAMAERPQLKLNIPLTVVTDADAAALNETAFKQALNGVLANAATANNTQRLTALTTLYKARVGSTPTFPASNEPATEVTTSHIAYLEAQLKPLYAIGAADRDALTRARADTVQAALLVNSELAAERIYLTARSNEVESPNGVVRMELKLE